MTATSTAEPAGINVITIGDDVPVVLLSTLVDRCPAALRSDAHLTILDLSAAEYIDAGGLAAVVGLDRALEAEDRRLVVACSHNVRRLFELAGLHQRIALAGSVDAAMFVWG